MLLAGVVGVMLLVGADDDGPTPARPAPQWTAASLNGSPSGSGQLEGKPYIIDFWSADCAPCVAEFGDLTQFASAQAKAGIPVFGVTGDTRGRFEKFAKGRDITLPVLFDQNGSAQAAFGVQSLPTAIVVDRSGQVVYRQSPPDFARLTEAASRLSGTP